MTGSGKPTLAVWKFASCDGCQLTLLNCEDELLNVAELVEIASFPEASRAAVAGPYDLSIVEGSITTPGDAERIRRVREASRFLVTIGACATSGGIQALRNFADVEEFTSVVYASPQYIDTLRTSTAIADHVRVDFELRGCPIDRRQLLDVVAAFLHGRKPNVRGHSVCIECKRAGITCVMVAPRFGETPSLGETRGFGETRGTPCLGPVTQAGCGALCPSFARGCYGCFGPMEAPNTAALSARWQELGVDGPGLVRAFRAFTANAEPFRKEAEEHDTR